MSSGICSHPIAFRPSVRARRAAALSFSCSLVAIAIRPPVVAAPVRRVCAGAAAGSPVYVKSCRPIHRMFSSITTRTVLAPCLVVLYILNFSRWTAPWRGHGSACMC